MNRLERLVYDRLKANPAFKKAIVGLYQRLLYSIPITRERSRSPLVPRPGAFFGFHDKCPFSPDGSFLLAHRSEAPLRRPQEGDTAEIGLYLGEDLLQYRPLTNTRAWNWQMGAMLQWVGGSNTLIFNDCADGALIARRLTHDGAELGALQRPVAALSPDGKWAAGHSFCRMRHTVHSAGYAYANGSEPEADLPLSNKHCVYTINLADGSTQDLFSLQDIASIAPDDTMQDAFHYFTHCLFSPSGNRFVFYHRWVQDNNRYWTRMFSCGLDGSDIHLFPTAGFVSHIAWSDADHILAYCSSPRFGDGYHLFKDRTDDYALVGQKVFSSDGHPHYSPDGRYILTDTYPDRFRRQKLLLFDVKEEILDELAACKIPFDFRADVRCDFHPRWNREGTIVCFDSAHSGTRTLYTMQLKQEESR